MRKQDKIKLISEKYNNNSWKKHSIGDLVMWVENLRERSLHHDTTEIEKIKKDILDAKSYFTMLDEMLKTKGFDYKNHVSKEKKVTKASGEFTRAKGLQRAITIQNLADNIEKGFATQSDKDLLYFCMKILNATVIGRQQAIAWIDDKQKSRKRWF